MLNIDCPPLAAVLAPDKRLALYGAGGCGAGVHAWLSQRGIAPVAVLDARGEGEAFGLAVRAPEAAVELELDAVLIGSMYGREMNATLRAAGYQGPVLDLSALHVERWHGHFDHAFLDAQADAIAAARAELADEPSRARFDALVAYRRTLDNSVLPEPTEQYRPRDVRLEPGECVLDVGGFDGDSAVDYARELGEGARVHAFEPMESNFRELEARLARDPVGAQVTPWRLAAWNERTTLALSSDEPHPMQFRVHPEGDTRVPALPLDDWASENAIERVDWIKMDVEGAEREALEGAARTIAAQRCKLAISLYHRPDDLWFLIRQMRSLRPDAPLYVEHHSQNLYESVCYAGR